MKTIPSYSKECVPSVFLVRLGKSFIRTMGGGMAFGVPSFVVRHSFIGQPVEEGRDGGVHRLVVCPVCRVTNAIIPGNALATQHYLTSPLPAPYRTRTIVRLPTGCPRLA